MSVQETLRALLLLQGIDKTIYDYDQEVAAIPDQKNDLDAQFAEKESILNEHDKKYKDLQVAKKSKELDMAKKEEDIKKREVQLYQVKTNKDYTAIEIEIKGMRADNSVFEEEILMLMDMIESIEKDVKSEKEKLVGDKKECESGKVKLDSRKKELDSELEKLRAQRGAILPKVDKNILIRYERILPAREGVAMVPTSGETCGGCFNRLPPQIINEVKILENIKICDQCSRILYPEEWTT